MKRKMTAAVGYIRMSSDQQEASPARQKSEIEQLADREGYKIIRWYEDRGLTGTKSGTFQAILMNEQSRFSREDVFAVVAHWHLLREAGAVVQPGPSCAQLVPALVYEQEDIDQLAMSLRQGLDRALEKL